MKKLILPLIILLFLSSCNPWKYIAEYDHEADFSKYKTFGLLNWDPHNDKVMSPQTKEYILMAIKAELEARGYVYQKSGADLQVSVFAVVEEETSYSAYSDHYAGYNGYGAVAIGVGVGSGGAGVGVVGYGSPGMYPYTAVTHDYNVGTLVVDLLDDSKKKIVWQGVATGRIGYEEAKESSVKKDIGRLFAKMPVDKVKK
ncbi:MAG: DUF4136 domain-containing protein [Bacteroidales bacterium]|nr:DUF4136 domain-containing protein [Bacteroidales bacterium]MCF6342397.1 DUF4136 domain-containing protein [Bacteroidales bacterium]